MGMNFYYEDNLIDWTPEEIRKSLWPDYTTGTSSTNANTVMKEDLENYLHILSFGKDMFPWWAQIPKERASHLVKQYATLTDHGNYDYANNDFQRLPKDVAPNFARDYTNLKEIAVTGFVPDVAMAEEMVGDRNLIEQVTESQTLGLLSKVERDMIVADSSINSLEFDGIVARVVAAGTSDNIIDCRNGAAPGNVTQTILETAAEVVKDVGYGMANKVFLPLSQSKQLAITLQGYARYSFNQGNQTPNQVGLALSDLIAQHADLEIHSDRFLRSTWMSPLITATTEGDATACPGTPTLTHSAGAHATSQFAASVDNGNYYYKVRACNRDGGSAPVASSVQAVAASERVTLTITHAAGIAPEYFKIYRTAKGGAQGTERLILRVKASTGATTTAYDVNNILPNSTYGVVCDWNLSDKNISWAQLEPYKRIPLAKVDETTRWLQRIWGAPIYYAPKRFVVLKNLA